ncbi:hypothetical protein GBAR_LOCUS4918, partial [Geodia barretti]
MALKLLPPGNGGSYIYVDPHAPRGDVEALVSPEPATLREAQEVLPRFRLASVLQPQEPVIAQVMAPIGGEVLVLLLLSAHCFAQEIVPSPEEYHWSSLKPISSFFNVRPGLY